MSLQKMRLAKFFLGEKKNTPTGLSGRPECRSIFLPQENLPTTRQDDRPESSIALVAYGALAGKGKAERR